jgi:hypothetical protein
MTPTQTDFGAIMAGWAERDHSISGLALIGSHARPGDNALERADAHSDWDFHVITAEPGVFSDRTWARGLAGVQLKAYAARSTRVGRVPKVNAVFSGFEADFVIIPSRTLWFARGLSLLGRHRRDGWARRFFQDLAIVIRPGWRFVKDTRGWNSVYRLAVAEVPDARIDDRAAVRLADGFVCDYVWTLRKIDRGELRTAQRMIHRELAETNYRLLHEAKLRRGERSFPEARRIERIGSPAELDAVTLEAPLDPAALRAALDKSAATLRSLVAGLVGQTWTWPLGNG